MGVTHAAVNVWHWSARLPVREWILLKDKLISTSLAWKDKLRFWQGVFTGTHRDSLILGNYRYFKALLNEKWNTYLLPVDAATWFVEHKSKITRSDEGKKNQHVINLYQSALPLQIFLDRPWWPLLSPWPGIWPCSLLALISHSRGDRKLFVAMYSEVQLSMEAVIHSENPQRARVIIHTLSKKWLWCDYKCNIWFISYNFTMKLTPWNKTIELFLVVWKSWCYCVPLNLSLRLRIW